VTICHIPVDDSFRGSQLSNFIIAWILNFCVCKVGDNDGIKEGKNDGRYDAMKDGVDVNVVLGIRDGNIDIDGSDVGVIEGNTNIVGTDDGEDEGKSLGDIVEVLDGSCVCIKVGVEVGNFDGVDVVIALG